MDATHPIDGQPSVQVLLGTREGEDLLFLSCLYGSFRFETGAPVSRDEVTRFRCPHCAESLVTDAACGTCGAPMAGLSLSEGSVDFCTRRGCKGHRLNVDDPTKLLDGPATER
jgi:hypothetical protein